MARRPDDDPGLPIKWHPVSNGEFVPPPRHPPGARGHPAEPGGARRQRPAARREPPPVPAVGLRVGHHARRARRCSKDEAQERPKPGGTFDVPPEATTEPEAAAEAIGGDELMFDVQTHLLEFPPGAPGGTPIGFPQSDCGEGDWHDCYRRPAFLDLMFLESDTSAIVLSAIPFPGDLLSAEVMAETIRIGEELCGDGRVFMQAQTNPSAAPVAQLRESMAQVAADFPITAWKAYCHAGGPGWFLDDHDPTAPQVRRGVPLAGRGARRPRVAIHKGFTTIGGVGPDAARFSDPVDVGPAAAAHPDVDIMVYHSGFDVGPAEGPYAAANDARRRPAHPLDAGGRHRARAATSTPSWAPRGGS